MDKTKFYIDLSKCTEEEKKRIFSLLPEPRNWKVYAMFDNDVFLNYNTDEWIVGSKIYIADKQELTYPEFIKLFEVGESKEVLQVDIYSGELNTERILTYKKLSEKYNIQESTVRDIFNTGAEWVINFKSNQ